MCPPHSAFSSASHTLGHRRIARTGTRFLAQRAKDLQAKMLEIDRHHDDPQAELEGRAARVDVSLMFMLQAIKPSFIGVIIACAGNVLISLAL